MTNSQLIQLLNTLTTTERKQLTQWVAFPLHNNRPEVTQLCTYICTHIGKAPTALRKETAWAALFPKAKYDATQMDLLQSYLLKATKQWLAWATWQNDPIQVQMSLLPALRNRGLDAQLAKETQKTEQLLQAQSRRDAPYFYQKHQLEQERQRAHSRSRRDGDLSLQGSNDSLLTAYLLELSNYLCSVAALSQISKQDLDISQSIALYETAEKVGILETVPTLAVYRDLLRIARSTDETEAFLRIKTFLSTDIGLFSPEEARNIQLIANNFCIRNINAGRRTYIRDLFELYRVGLSARTLYEGKYLSTFTFKNIVTAGLSAGEAAWVRTFLEEYRQDLPLKERESSYRFNLAVWHFRQQDLEQAMTIVRDTDFGDDALTNLAARAMLLRIYYEKNYFDALESLLDSFQAYLNRQKNLGYQAENYLNLIRFTRKMQRLVPNDVKSRAKLKEEILSTEVLAERAWLLEVVG
jgi:hypothetical protein